MMGLGLSCLIVSQQLTALTPACILISIHPLYMAPPRRCFRIRHIIATFLGLVFKYLFTLTLSGPLYIASDLIAFHHSFSPPSASRIIIVYPLVARTSSTNPTFPDIPRGPISNTPGNKPNQSMLTILSLEAFAGRSHDVHFLSTFPSCVLRV